MLCVFCSTAPPTGSSLIFLPLLPAFSSLRHINIEILPITLQQPLSVQVRSVCIVSLKSKLGMIRYGEEAMSKAEADQKLGVLYQ